MARPKDEEIALLCTPNTTSTLDGDGLDAAGTSVIVKNLDTISTFVGRNTFHFINLAR